MFKKILLTAAALSGFALVASQAEAGYGHGYHSYGHGHHRRHYSSYDYGCYKRRPVVIRVWDDYSCEYIYKTVYRRYNVCY